MNIYKVLNDITLYIDEHLDEKIEYETLSKMMGVNNYTMQRIFSLIAGVPLAEYIRKRRLSMAAFDLVSGNYKVMDLAIKYSYENATSFSRAFEAFHGVKPSEVSKETELKDFPRIIFDENVTFKNDIEYSIVDLPKMTLYGIGMNTNENDIKRDVPAFFRDVESKYIEKHGPVKYGMVSYKDPERLYPTSYHVLYDKKIGEFKCVEIPESKWLKFKIDTQDASDIQEASRKFYYEFLPSTKYNLKDIPELEYYHDGITEFLVPIY